MGIEVSEEFCSSAAPEKSGAGGRGRRGLPPYLDDGVPGRGLPLISAGSYETVDAGGRGQSEEPLVGVDGRIDARRSGEMLRGLAVGKGMVGG